MTRDRFCNFRHLHLGTNYLYRWIFHLFFEQIILIGNLTNLAWEMNDTGK